MIPATLGLVGLVRMVNSKLRERQGGDQLGKISNVNQILASKRQAQTCPPPPKKNHEYTFLKIGEISSKDSPSRISITIKVVCYLESGLV